MKNLSDEILNLKKELKDKDSHIKRLNRKTKDFEDEALETEKHWEQKLKKKSIRR